MLIKLINLINVCNFCLKGFLFDVCSFTNFSHMNFVTLCHCMFCHAHNLQKPIKKIAVKIVAMILVRYNLRFALPIVLSCI